MREADIRLPLGMLQEANDMVKEFRVNAVYPNMELEYQSRRYVAIVRVRRQIGTGTK